MRVNATDTSVVRQNQSTATNSVGLTNIYDLNKDGRVNATDTSMVRQNQSATLIRFFTAPNNLSIAEASEDVSIPTIEFDTWQLGAGITGLKRDRQAKSFR